MTKIIINLIEIQRDKAVQSCTNLSKGSAMFVPQLNKAPIKGCILLGCTEVSLMLYEASPMVY